MRSSRLLAVTGLSAALVLAACGESSQDDTSGGGGSGDFPVTIEHAFGETTIESEPERVATVAWSNHEVPLALGIVPVGMSEAVWARVRSLQETVADPLPEMRPFDEA